MRIETLPDTLVRLDVYVVGTSNASGHGGTARHLGSEQVLTDEDGVYTDLFSFAVSIAEGEHLTATLTLVAPDGTLGATGELAANTVVERINEAPVVTSGDFVVEENETFAGTVTASDPDGDALVFSIVGGADATRFSIERSTGQLTFIVAPDAEAPSDADGDGTHRLLIEVSDGKLVVSRQIAVTVTNVDEWSVEAPQDVDASPDAVDEDAAVGSTVGVTAQSVDRDVDDSVVYALVDDAEGRFAIDAQSGVVTLVGPVDADRDASHSITVRSSSTGGGVADATFVIAIGDVNDTAPVVTPGQSFAIDENSPGGTAFGAVIATDVDREGTLGGWSIDGGDDGARFVIDATSGELTLAPEATLDAESRRTYSLTVSVGDGVARSAPESIVITVRDVQERPQATGDGFSASEDSSLTIDPAILLENDHDPDGDPLEVRIVTGPANGTLTPDARGLLIYQPDPDFAGTDTFSYVAVDAHGESEPVAVSIDVASINDAPRLLVAATASIAENASGPVVSASATDVDSAAPTFALEGADAEGFAIDAASGEISARVPLDAESPTDADRDGRHELVVVARDQEGGESRAALTVDVLNVNEAPSLSDRAFSLSEGFVGTIGQLEASDPDTGDTLAYELVAGGEVPGADRFAVEADGGLNVDGASTGMSVARISIATQSSAIRRIRRTTMR